METKSDSDPASILAEQLGITLKQAREVIDLGELVKKGEPPGYSQIEFTDDPSLVRPRLTTGVRFIHNKPIPILTLTTGDAGYEQDKNTRLEEIANLISKVTGQDVQVVSRAQQDTKTPKGKSEGKRFWLPWRR